MVRGLAEKSVGVEGWVLELHLAVEVGGKAVGAEEVHSGLLDAEINGVADDGDRKVGGGQVDIVDPGAGNVADLSVLDGESLPTMAELEGVAVEVEVASGIHGELVSADVHGNLADDSGGLATAGIMEVTIVLDVGGRQDVEPGAVGTHDLVGFTLKTTEDGVLLESTQSSSSGGSGSSGSGSGRFASGSGSRSGGCGRFASGSGS